MWAGRLSNPSLPPPFRPILNPNFVAIHPLTERRQGLAHEFLVLEWAVDFCRVEEGDAALNGRANHRDHRLLFARWTVAGAHSHAAQPEGRDFQIALPKFSLFHRYSPILNDRLQSQEPRNF